MNELDESDRKTLREIGTFMRGCVCMPILGLAVLGCIWLWEKLFT